MENKVRIGVVGAGWWAVSNHLPLLKARRDVELTGVCRLGKAELAEVQERFDIPYGTEDFDTLLAECPMDALIVATPHKLHGPQTLAALRKGLHVLVEKPMATDATEAREIVTESQKRGLQVLVPYGWNFMEFFGVARRWIADGRIGELRHVSAVMASPIGDLMSGGQLAGTENEMFRPDPNTWANAAWGGYGWGQLVHLLGGVFYVTDLEPRQAFAFVGRSQLGADLFNALSLQCAKGETVAISGAATVPAGKPFQLDIRVYGTDGMLLLDVERERLVLERMDGTGDSFAIAPGAGAYACIEPINRFVELCKGKKVENAADATVGGRAVGVVSAMLRSAQSGRAEAI